MGLDRCSKCYTGAAPITKDTLEFFLSLDIPLYELYGMSESTGPHTISRPDAYKLTRCVSRGTSLYWSNASDTWLRKVNEENVFCSAAAVKRSQGARRSCTTRTRRETEKSASGVVTCSWVTSTCPRRRRRLWMQRAGCTQVTWENTTRTASSSSPGGLKVFLRLVPVERASSPEKLTVPVALRWFL